MTRLERTLHAYVDGELGRLSRACFEARLRRSAKLRCELAELRDLQALAREVEPPVGASGLWGDLSGRLASIDAAVEAERAERRWRPIRLPFPAGALAATAFAAALLAAVLTLDQWPGSELIPEGIQASGVIRYLDTGERSVMLVEDLESVTIIWLMGPEGSEV